MLGQYWYKLRLLYRASYAVLSFLWRKKWQKSAADDKSIAAGHTHQRSAGQHSCRGSPPAPPQPLPVSSCGGPGGATSSWDLSLTKKVEAKQQQQQQQQQQQHRRHWILPIVHLTQNVRCVQVATWTKRKSVHNEHSLLAIGVPLS